MPFITTGPVTAGNIIPGSPGVITVFGGANIDYGAISGARFQVGGWFPGSDTVGIEGGGLVLNKQYFNAGVSSGTLGLPAIGRPFLNANTGAIGTFLVSAPNAAAGTAGDVGSALGTSSSQLWTAEINLIGNLYRDTFWTWNAMVGFRHFDLAEVIQVASTSTQGPAGSPVYTFQGTALTAGQHLSIIDRYETQNRFYGGNLGTEVEWRYHRITFDVRNDVAIGAMRSTVTNIGVTTATTAAGANLAGSPANGGLLALPTNGGSRIQDNFSVVEQPGIQIGYQITRGIRISCGYDFIYAFNVARPGLQVDPGINPNLVPSSPTFGTPGGTARPSPLFALTDYYAQGVSWALTLRY